MEKPKAIYKHKSFQKSYAKLPSKRQARVDQALRRFAANPVDRRLNLHELRPQGCGIWSINAGGDLRCLLVETKEGVTFIALGSHSQLYG